MRCVGEHIDRLNSCNLIIFVQKCQIASLCCGVTTYINNSLWVRAQNYVHHVGVHAGTRRVGNNYFGATVLLYKLFGQNIFHVARIEQCINNVVYLRIYFSIFYCFRYIFNADYLLCLLCHKVCDGSRARI